MKNKISILIFLAALLISCNEDYLSIDDPNFPTAASFWENVDDADKGLTATYSQFTRPGNWGRWIYFRYDLTSDEGYSNSPWVTLADWTRFIYTDYNFIQGGSLMYKSHYKQIFEANQVIANVPDIEANDAEEEQRLKQIVAQAKFIRAFDYFNLAIMFGKAEIVLQPSSAGDTYDEANTDTLYAIIIRDLNDAIADLPAEWGEADKGRVTKGAAYALLGKTYMQMHEWQNAKDAFDWLVEGDGKGYYGLMDNYFDNFTHYKENNKESVFEIQFSDASQREMDRNNGSMIDDDLPNMSLGNTRSQFFAPVGWRDGQPRSWLVDEYKKEPTKDNTVNGTTIDDRLRVSIIYEEIFDDFPNETLFAGTIDKYPRAWRRNIFFRKYGDDYFKAATDYYSPINYRVIRYADVLLCYAECLANLNQLSLAIPYVDMVRERPSTNLSKLADSPVTEIAASVTSKELFLKRLQMERALELSLESVRWIDIKRWGLLDTQEGIDELASRDPDFENFVIGKHNVLPLPQYEVDNNDKLSQNDNY
ncbi:RagB/SusD family nutrient uptake outer membrane protein [Saccharicrinis sp. FJH62]|uniref:RagB/SusD family nutrient uptake outer membrane protein n=1 Tax=Saccharicrinis sp. FJH62 TaxID=3344657 RepID=UPI0035D43D08